MTEHLIKKNREWFRFISALAVGGILYSIQSESMGMLILLALVQTICIYEAIKSLSTYDISTWTHRKHIQAYIFMGCFFVGIGGLTYYILKSIEIQFVNGKFDNTY